MKYIMKSMLVTALGLFVLLQGCVMPESARLGDQSLASNDYIGAVKYYEQALSQASDSTIRKQIEQKITQVKLTIATTYLKKASLALSGEPDRVLALGNATNILNQVVQWDDQRGRINAQLNAYKVEQEQTLKDRQAQLQRKSQNSLKLVAGKIANYDFAAALQIVTAALTADPSNQKLKSSKQAVSRLGELYRSTQEQLADGQLQQAMDSFKLMAKVSPVKLDFNKLPLKDELVLSIQQEVEKLGRRTKWLAAYSLLSYVNLPELAGEFAEVRSKGSMSFLERARQVEEKGDTHLAYLLTEKAMLLNDKNLEIFNLNKRTRDIVNRSLQQNIAIASFDSPSNDPDAGIQFSDSLTSYLYNVLPYGINILERDKIDYILKERNKSTEDVGKVLGVDLIVTGRVSLFKIETSEDLRKVKVKVKSGEHVVENPEFAQMIRLYGKDQSLWPSIPPKTIKRKVSEMVTYEKGTARLKGFAKVSVRIFDTAKATITFVRDYPASIEDTCEFHDEVPGAGIEFLAKELISNIEAKDAMRKEIVTEIGKVVQSSFNAREVRFLNQANFYLERREPKLAYKPLAEGYLYCLRDNIEMDNKTFLQIQELIDLRIE